MTNAPAHPSIGSRFVGLLEHAAFVAVGVVMMVLGLGLSVTMIMLPVGLVVGLLGFAMFIGGMTAHIQKS